MICAIPTTFSRKYNDTQSGQGLSRPGKAYDTILRFCACSNNISSAAIFAQGTQEKKKEKRDEYDQMNAL